MRYKRIKFFLSTVHLNGKQNLQRNIQYLLYTPKYLKHANLLDLPLHDVIGKRGGV